MTREEAIHFAECLKKNWTINFADMEEFCDMAIEALPSADTDRPTRLTNAEWKDFLSESFGISKSSAREMLHGMMSVKREDNFKKRFNQRRGERREP